MSEPAAAISGDPFWAASRRDRGTPGGVETWEQGRERYLAQAECEAGTAARMNLKRHAEEQARRMAECREEFLMRRKERQQIEILKEAAERRRAVEEDRRQQRTLDDWYAARRASSVRRLSEA